MRYLEAESTYILSNFTTGDTVTITVYKLSDNSKVIDAVACSEIGTTGRFKYSFSQSISTKTEYLWVAENGTEEQQGKIILGGWPDEIAKIPFETWEEILTGATHNIATSAGRRVREIGAFAIESGTAQAGNGHSITLAATADANDGVYNRNLIVLVDNTGVGQTRTIVDYDGTSKVCVIDRDWRISPDATTEYQIVPDDTPLTVDHGVARGGTASTITIRAYASSVDDAYLCNIVTIIAGKGRGQARLVGGYNGTSNIVTICGDDWVEIPDTTSIYAMMPYGVACAACVGDVALAQIKAEIDTDVATQDSASSFTCTAGVAADNAYIGMIVRVRDADDDHWEDRMITGWTAGRVMTVDKPFSFTPAVNDLVWILSQYEEKDTTFVNR